MNKLRTTRLRHLFGVAVALICITALLQVNGASMAYANMMSTSTPPPVTPSLTPPGKNSTQSELVTDSGSFTITLPDPSSKNGIIKPVFENSTGETFAGLPDPGSKNFDSRIPPTPLSENIVALLDAGGSLITCGAAPLYEDWTSTSNSFQVIQQCTLNLPQAGWVFFSANGSAALRDAEYEAAFSIDIDNTDGDDAIDRWVNVYFDTGDGTDRSVALSMLKPVTAGSHTFYFLGRRFGGAGTAVLMDPSLTVIFIPAPASQILTCESSGNLNWTTTNASFQVIRQCAITVPQDGWVFLSANGSVGRQDDEYEARFRIGIDATTGDSGTDRWVNVYNDSGDGTDKAVSSSVLKSVNAGTHTFYFLGSRFSGEGTVLLYDPTLTAIFIPAASSPAVTCGASGDLAWSTISNNFQIIRQCILTVPQDGWVYLSADTSVARQDGEYEAMLGIGIDSTSSTTTVERWVNVYNDSGDGTDETVALSVLSSVTAGTHIFNFLGKRYGGTGTVLLLDPTLSVIAPNGPKIYLPLLLK